jgi:predicted SpoU family rRNA methylase
MKAVNPCSIGLVTLLGLGLSIGLVWKVKAQTPTCIGAECRDRNPVEYGCDRDATVTAQFRTTVNRWQDAGAAQLIVIQKMYSESCQANWSRAYIPSGTYLYIREEVADPSIQPIVGMAKAEGSGYVWADSNMSEGNVSNQACAALPIFFDGTGHDLYDRYCTELN